MRGTVHAPPLVLLPARKPLQDAVMWGVLPLESVVQQPTIQPVALDSCQFVVFKMARILAARYKSYVQPAIQPATSVILRFTRVK